METYLDQLRKREKTKISKIRDELQVIIIDTTELQRIMRDYNEQL
jgi:hypothetical protein